MTSWIALFKDSQFDDIFQQIFRNPFQIDILFDQYTVQKIWHMVITKFWGCISQI